VATQPAADIHRAASALSGYMILAAAADQIRSTCYLSARRARRAGPLHFRYTPGRHREDFPDLFRERLAQYGSYLAELRNSLNKDSDIVYSPNEPLLLPWPWFRGRIAIGGDAAHTFPPHLTQGAAMAVEDAIILAREVLDGEGTLETRLMAYSQTRYARCAFVYAFARQ
jgi:2-polyprenyl-6-methoxyphenol hydroxylase-like FAD-dependent oxidoreductase